MVARASTGRARGGARLLLDEAVRLWGAAGVERPKSHRRTPGVTRASRRDPNSPRRCCDLWPAGRCSGSPVTAFTKPAASRERLRAPRSPHDSTTHSSSRLKPSPRAFTCAKEPSWRFLPNSSIRSSKPKPTTNAAASVNRRSACASSRSPNCRAASGASKWSRSGTTAIPRTTSRSSTATPSAARTFRRACTRSASPVTRSVRCAATAATSSRWRCSGSPRRSAAWCSTCGRRGVASAC